MPDLKPLPSLTDCGGDDVYPASDWAKYLVQTVGRDVMSFCRNTRVSYMILDRARETVKGINNYIDEVNSGANGAYDIFKKYTEAIDPLEEELLKLVLIADNEKELHFANVTSSVSDCIQSVDTWEVEREKLSKVLELFNTHDKLKGLFNESDAAPRETTRLKARVEDDKSFLAELRDSIGTLVSKHPASSLSHIGQQVDSLKTLQEGVITTSGTNWKTDITIKTSMLVQAVLEIVTRPVATPLTPDTLKHLKSVDVWKAVEELIKALTSGDETSSGKKYTDFKEKLLGSSELNLPSYIDLLKAAAKIRRPFQAQAFALTNLFFYLVDQFNRDLKSVVHPEHISALDAVYDKALNALNGAANIEAVKQLQFFSLDTFDQDSTVKDFQAVNKSIGKVFKTFDSNLGSQWDGGKEGDLAAAYTKDKNRMTQLNDRVTKCSPTVTPPTLKVTISIEQSGEGPVTASSNEETSTRLHALRWRVASLLTVPEKVELARNTGKFQRKVDGGTDELVNLDSTLEKIKGSGSEVVLKLVVA